MERGSPLVLLLDGSGVSSEAASTLGHGDEDLTVATSTAETTRTLGSTRVDCVVTARPSEEDQLDAVSAIREVAPTVPVVSLLYPGDGVGPKAALDRGASDCVHAVGDPGDWGPLLSERVQTAVRNRDRIDGSVCRDAIETALRETEDEGLFCLFDRDRRHRLVVGAAPAAPLDHARLEGARIDQLDVDPDLRLRLEAVYAAALEGESRSRTVPVGGNSVQVETWPLAEADGAYGVVRYSPTEGPGFDADEAIQEKIQRLHDVASQLDELEDESEISSLAIAAANSVLEFDACAIGEVVDGEVVPMAATADRPQGTTTGLAADEGIVGRTLSEGTAIIVEDVREAPVAVPEENYPYRSVLSIPMGEFGVFQAVSTEVGSYTETDRELGELLVAHVTHALERVRYERAITEERDRFAALFENVPDPAIQYVFDGAEPRVDAVNSAFVRVFGYDPEEVVGESPLELLVSREERDEAREIYETVRDGERLEREVERLTVDGSAPFLLRSVPAGSDDGDRRGYVIYTDISDLIERERQLQRQNERLDAFASIVSHDLRNPLSAAQGYLEMALDTGDTEHLEVVREEHDRMSRMIDDLLTLAKQGESIGETEPVELGAVVESAWDGVDTADATLSVGTLPTVEGDADRLRQLFENLFRNAVLHGGEDVAVQVGHFERGVFVADDGPGVPDDMKDRILDTGVSTAEGDGGTGFGLSIVNEVASAHGWALEVTDSESGGARFEVLTDPDPEEGSGRTVGRVENR